MRARKNQTNSKHSKNPQAEPAIPNAAALERPSLAVLALGLVYESLIVTALVIGGLLIPHALIGATTGYVASGRVLAGHMLIMLLIYFVWQWLRGGQTLAMKTWRLKLVADPRQPLRPAQAVLRYTAGWLSIALLGAGFLWALVDKERRFLHDRIAGTRILREPKIKQ